MTGTNHSVRSQLEIALAINRGIEFLHNVEKTKGFETGSHTASDRSQVLQTLFFQTHLKLFQDTHTFNGKNKPITKGDTESPDPRRKNAREVIDSLATALYKETGVLKPLNIDRAIDALAQAYFELNKISAFDADTGLTLRLYFTCLTKLPEWKNQFDVKLNFSRIDEKDVEILRNPSSADALHRVFSHALDYTRTPVYGDSNGNHWQPWTDKRVKIGGLNFLHEWENGVDYLITLNGGKVRRDKVEEALTKHLEQQKPVGSFTVSASLIEGFVDDHQNIRDELKLRHKTSIDGVPITDEVPLLCTEVNPLSGLSTRNHEILKQSLEGSKSYGKWLFQLNDPKIAAEKLKTAEALNPGIVPLLETAIGRIQGIVPIMDKAVESMFKGKTSVAPKFMAMSMGGGGSGKSATKDALKDKLRAAGLNEHNYVEASLDSSRDIFDHYTVISRLGHHADDYNVVEDAANAMRDWTAERALNGGYNLLYDGTGVPYQGRYDKICEQFKEHGFKTCVVGTDCMLYIPDERKAEFGKDAIERIIDRYERSRRALQWNVVRDKHIRFPLSFIKSVEDSAADEILLVDNGGKFGKSYVMASSFTVDDQTLNALRDAKKAGTLKDCITEKNLLPSRNDASPVLDEANIDFLEKRVGDSNRVLVITNVSRFLDMTQKGHMNIFAGTPDDLIGVNIDSAFLVPELDNPAGIPSKRGRLWLQRTAEQNAGGFNASTEHPTSPPPAKGK